MVGPLSVAAVATLIGFIVFRFDVVVALVVFGVWFSFGVIANNRYRSR